MLFYLTLVFEDLRVGHAKMFNRSQLYLILFIVIIAKLMAYTDALIYFGCVYQFKIQAEQKYNHICEASFSSFIKFFFFFVRQYIYEFTNK